MSKSYGEGNGFEFRAIVEGFVVYRRYRVFGSSVRYCRGDDDLSSVASFLFYHRYSVLRDRVYFVSDTVLIEGLGCCTRGDDETEEPECFLNAMVFHVS